MQPFRQERSHEENKERAYIAASRRTDRALSARIESAKRASKIHKQRTGRALRITVNDVLNENMYEEEDNDPPSLAGLPSDITERLSVYARINITDKSALASLERLVQNHYDPQRDSQHWGPCNFAAAQPWLDNQKLLRTRALSAMTDNPDFSLAVQSPPDSFAPNADATDDGCLSPGASSSRSLSASAILDHVAMSDMTMSSSSTKNGILYPMFESYSVDDEYSDPLALAASCTRDGLSQTSEPVVILDTRGQTNAPRFSTPWDLASDDCPQAFNSDTTPEEGFYQINHPLEGFNAGPAYNGLYGVVAGDALHQPSANPLEEYWSQYFDANAEEEERL